MLLQFVIENIFGRSSLSVPGTARRFSRQHLLMIVLFVVTGTVFGGMKKAAFASTTIGLNISTGGTLTVTGAASLQGGASVSDGQLLDLSSIQPTAGTNEGIKLPQASGSLGAPSSGVGYLAYRTETSALQYYDGAAWISVTTSTVASSFTPSANNTYDLGKFGGAWKDVYSSGTVRIGTGTTIDGTTLTLAAASGFNLGKFFVDSSGNVNASGTVRSASGLTTGGTIQPTANNTVDIGAFGSAFKDVYASGSIRVGSGAASTTISSSGNITTTGNILPASNNASDIGAFGAATKDIYSSGTTRLGTLSNDGNTTLGDTSADTITLNARFASTLNPNANNTLDIGTFGTAWKDIYSSGTVRIGTGTIIDGTTLTLAAASGFNLGKFFVDASGNVNASGTVRTAAGLTTGGTIAPTANNTVDIGAFGSAFKDLYASGTARINTISVITALAPAANNSIDSGSFGSAWRDIYASGSVRVGSGAASTTISSSGNITTTGSLLPASNNASDVGAFGTAWRDIYASGTTRLATTTLADNTLLNLSNIAPTTGVNEGLQLPQTTTLGNPGSGAGYLAYDTDNFQLQYYDGIAWNAVVTSTASASTLQGAYGGGNAVTTTDARDLSFVLADTTTDANFDVNLVSSSTTVGDVPSFSTSTASRGVFRLHKDAQNLMIVDSSGTSTIFGTLNVNYPYAPRVIASLSATTQNPAAVISGHYAYLSDSTSNGLSIYDITDQRKPSKVNTNLSTTIGNVYSFQLQGRYLYAGSSSGVFIIDVSNVKTPTLVYTFTGSAFIGCSNPSCSVYVSGSYLYLTSPAGSPNSGLYVYDIRNPLHPVFLAKDQQGGGPQSVTGQGKYVYLGTNTTNSGGFIRAFDMTNPRRPLLIGSLTTSGITNSQMVVRGKYLYSGTTSGLLIVDVSDPTTLTLKSTTATLSPAACDVRVDVQGRYAYMSGQICTGSVGGFFVYDVASSTKPVLLYQTQGTGGYQDGIIVSGRYAFTLGSSAVSPLVWDINGAEISSASIGSLSAESLVVETDVEVWNRITAHGGVGISGGLNVDGEVGIFSYSSSTAFLISDINVAKQGDPVAAIYYQSATSTGLYLSVSTTNYAASGFDAMLRLDTTRVTSSLFNFFTANVASTGSATATVFRVDGLGSVYVSGTTYLGGSPAGNTIVARQTSSGTLASFFSQSSSTPNLYLNTSSTSMEITGLDGLLRIDAVTSTLPFRFNFITANWGSGVGGVTNTAFAVRGDGQIFSDAGTTITSPADLAELTKIHGPFDDYPDGTIVSQSPDDEEVAMVAVPSIGNVLGIATDRGVFMGSGRWGKEIQDFPGNIHDFEVAHGVRRISVAGYIKMRVNNENGPILPGDPLGLSETTPGEARRAKSGDLIVGMARASFPPKEHTTPPGAGSPSASVTNETEEAIDDTSSLATDDTSSQASSSPQETSSTTTVSHGLVEAVVGNGAGLAIQQAEQLQNQGMTQTEDGTFHQSSISLLTNGPTTINQLIVKDIASFHGELRVKGHAIFNEDMAGMAKFLPGSNTVHVTYSEPYAVIPVVTLTPEGDVPTRWWVSDRTEAGFIINIKQPSWQETYAFSWHALAVPEPQLFVSDGTHGPADKEYLWRDDGSGRRSTLLSPATDTSSIKPTPAVEGATTDIDVAPTEPVIGVLSTDSVTPVAEPSPSEPAPTSSDVPPATELPTSAVPDSGNPDGAGGPDPETWIPFLPFTRG